MKKTSIFLLVAVLVMMTGIMTACQDDTGGITPDKPYTDGTYKSYGVGELNTTTHEIEGTVVIFDKLEDKENDFFYLWYGKTTFILDGNTFTSYTDGEKVTSCKFKFDKDIVTFLDDNEDPHPVLQTSGNLNILKNNMLILGMVIENDYALGLIFKKQ